jgi:hypothetical protein
MAAGRDIRTLIEELNEKAGKELYYDDDLYVEPDHEVGRKSKTPDGRPWVTLFDLRQAEPQPAGTVFRNSKLYCHLLNTLRNPARACDEDLELIKYVLFGSKLCSLCETRHWIKELETAPAKVWDAIKSHHGELVSLYGRLTNTQAATKFWLNTDAVADKIKQADSEV